jgi:hypothetical protein
MQDGHDNPLDEVLAMLATRYRAEGATADEFQHAARMAFEAADRPELRLVEIRSARVRQEDVSRIRQIVEPKLLAAEESVAELIDACANLGEPDDERVTVTTAVFLSTQIQ